MLNQKILFVSRFSIWSNMNYLLIRFWTNSSALSHRFTFIFILWVALWMWFRVMQSTHSHLAVLLSNFFMSNQKPIMWRTCAHFWISVPLISSWKEGATTSGDMLTMVQWLTQLPHTKQAPGWIPFWSLAGFLPHSKNMSIWFTGDSKLLRGVSVWGACVWESVLWWTSCLGCIPVLGACWDNHTVAAECRVNKVQSIKLSLKQLSIRTWHSCGSTLAFATVFWATVSGLCGCSH